MPESRKRKKKNQSTAQGPGSQAVPKDIQSPTWWAPTMVTLMVIGLVWVVVTYLWEGTLPIPGLGNWNLAIGGVIAMSGFLMTMRWR